MEDPRADGELEFHFVKSNSFRVLHVDGFVGGATPSGKLIHLAVFSERSPIPKKVVHEVSKGSLGPEIIEKRVTKTGVFREIETDMIMSVDVAIALRAWLDEQIEAFQTTNAQIASLSEQGK